MNELKDIKGIGPKTITLLNKLSINNLMDLVMFYPFRYQSYKKTKLENLKTGDIITTDGIVESNPVVSFIKGKKLNYMSFRMIIEEESYKVQIFNRVFLKNNIIPGRILTVIGKVNKEKRTIAANNIEFSKLPDEEKISPIYHTVSGITSKSLYSIIQNAMGLDINYIDYIPEYLKEKHKFLDKKQSLEYIHNPTDLINLKKALIRLKYEELFIFMLRINYLKSLKRKKERLECIYIDKNIIDEFIRKLPFNLTMDQLKATNDILEDLNSKYPMNRLLQGDVGSGKTVIGIIGLYMNYLRGYQGALMAPTEILVTQHFKNVKNLLSIYNINVELLLGSNTKKEKEEIYKRLEDGKIDIIIGTHTLIQEKTIYKNLGLVITDEQHRFGVKQRKYLNKKGLYPDILYMSATPIPRTYALTIYGDMDISNIKMMPNGKKEIKTILKTNNDIKEVLIMINDELKNNHQVYVVAPLIEESEEVDSQNVLKLKDNFETAFGKSYKIGLLHGKMKKEKEDIMNDFKEGKIDILISTTVIEVGIDVPNATMMVIFNAEKFGLSQLHQLRGRVGRGTLKSTCILISDYDSKRLHILEEVQDGFIISEKDFELRGHGDLFGVKQSGDMTFKIADIKEDFKILMQAKEDSIDFLNNNFNNDDDIIFKKIIKEIDTLES